MGCQTGAMMLDMPRIKRVIWPCVIVLLGVAALGILLRQRKAPARAPVQGSAGATAPTTRKSPTVDTVAARATALAVARFAREATIRRCIADAFKRASGKNGRETMAGMNRLMTSLDAEVSELRRTLKPPQTNPSTMASSMPSSSPAMAMDGRLAGEVMLAQLDRQVADLAKNDLKLQGNELTEVQWLSIYEGAAESQGLSAGDLIERMIVLHGENLTEAKLRRLLGGDLPGPARAVLARQLLAHCPPEDTATVEQCARFYEALIARSADVPVVADGLLVRYVRELDRRNAPEVANQALDSIIGLTPDTKLGARAAALRIAGQSGQARDKLVRSLREGYVGTEVATLLKQPYVELLVRENRFIEAFQALDEQRVISRAATGDQLLGAIADVAMRVRATSPLLLSQRQIGSPEAQTGPEAVTATQMCIGLAEELTGSKLAEPTAEGEAEATGQPGTDTSSKAGLVALLQRGTQGLPAESIRQTILAGQKDSGTLVSQEHAASKIAPQRLYEVTWQANFLSNAGKGAEAAAAYKAFIKEYGSDAENVAKARKQLVELLLRQEPVDGAELDQQLSAMEDGEKTMTPMLWNQRLRGLIRRVMSSPAAERQAIWAKGVQTLRQTASALSEETLSDLEMLASKLGGSASQTAMTVLTDMLLLTANTETMRRLQTMRVSVLLGQKAWEDAERATCLELAMTSVTAAGPNEAAKRLGAMIEKAEMPLEARQSLEARIQGFMHGSVAQTQPVKAWAVDSILQRAADAQGQGGASTPGRRHAAFLRFFAGQSEQALREAHAALSQTPATEEVFGVLDDIAVMLSAADGSFAGSNRFAQWLADRKPSGGGTPAATQQATAQTEGAPDRLLAVLLQCERKTSALIDLESDVRGDASSDKMLVVLPSKQFNVAPQGIRSELAKAALRRWGQRAVGWGTAMLASGDIAGAQGIWLTALNAQRHRGHAGSLMDIVAQSLQASASQGQAEEKLTLLEEMVPKLVVAGDRTSLQMRIVSIRRQTGLKTAKDLFDEGNYTQCLATLDELDKKCPEVKGAGDVAAGFMRALCLIRLEKLTEAAGLLRTMESWPGSAEQHARALFLTGWIFLQTDEKPSALAVFKRVSEAYPQTSFAAKATKLAAGME